MLCKTSKSTCGFVTFLRPHHDNNDLQCNCNRMMGSAPLRAPWLLKKPLMLTPSSVSLGKAVGGSGPNTSPPMPTKRYGTAVVCSGRSLVVAGGTGDSITILSTVEVMDTESPQWFTASSLPHPLYEASATICGENLYLLGGFDQSGYETKSVFTCSLSALLQSSQSPPPV